MTGREQPTATDRSLNVVLTPATITKLDLHPGDIIIVRSSTNLTAEQTGQIGDTVKQAVGDHKVLILSPNLSVEVVERQDA